MRRGFARARNRAANTISASRHFRFGKRAAPSACRRRQRDQRFVGAHRRNYGENLEQ